MSYPDVGLYIDMLCLRRFVKFEEALKHDNNYAWLFQAWLITNNHNHSTINQDRATTVVCHYRESGKTATCDQCNAP